MKKCLVLLFLMAMPLIASAQNSLDVLRGRTLQTTPSICAILPSGLVAMKDSEEEFVKKSCLVMIDVVTGQIWIAVADNKGNPEYVIQVDDDVQQIIWRSGIYI